MLPLSLARAAMRGYTWGVEYFLPTKENLKPVTGNLVYEDNKAAIQAWTAYDESNSFRESNYAATTYPLDLATVPGTAGLPHGWASGLNLDSPFASGKAGYPLPFARGGKASPRDFARGMMVAAASQRAMKYSLPPEGAGLDALGLLTSALAQTSLMGRVESLEEDYPAESLDGYYRTGQTPETPLRFFREDIEKLSLLLPDLSQLRVGDLLVHYGEEEGQSRDSFKLGMVLYAPVAGRPLPGQAGGAYFKQVVVLGANEGERQVGLYTWQSNGTSKGFSEKPEGWQLRRLVAKPASVTLLKSQTMGIMRSFGAEGIAISTLAGPASAGPPEAKTVIDPAIANISFKYEESYDHSSEAAGAPRNQRWIPNTGQYLVLSNLHLTAQNGDQASIDLSKALGEDFSLSFGIVDRNYYVSPASAGNITVNKGAGFEFVAKPKAGFDRAVAVPVANFKKTLGDRYDCESTPVYRTNQMTDYAEGYNFIIDAGQIKLTFTHGIFAFKDIYDTFAIRPYATDIHPGDDIILRVQISRKSDGTILKGADMNEKLYLAVYDKKLLWRANLYIDEGEANDWNNHYPWNAPPADNKDISGGNPKWWKAEWGLNEWNWKWDGNGPTAFGFNILSELAVGSGKQDIKLKAFTPLRTLKGTISEPSPENTISGTVAYSYPYHLHEPIQSGLRGTADEAGDAGSQDSPFDFVKKMLIQSNQLSEWYNDQGKRFLKPRSQWPNSDFLAAKQFSTIEQYASNVQAIDSAGILAWATLNKMSWYDYHTIAAFSLHRWDKGMAAPGNMWWHYDVSKPTTWSEENHSPPTTSFVPSLGLKIATFTAWPAGSELKQKFSDALDENFHSYDESIVKRLDFVDRSHVIEAGTDCVGFAQKAAGYEGNTRPYKWPRLPLGWSETGVDNIWDQLTTYNSSEERYRKYPIQDSLSDIIAERYISIDIPQPTLDALRRIVPGDIWVKDSINPPDKTKGDQDDIMSNHIAIVAFVPPNSAELDAQSLMNQIVLIEGEFANIIQSVIKYVTIGDYNRGRLSAAANGGDAYPGVPLPNEGVDLNCQAWAVRRLK